MTETELRAALTDLQTLALTMAAEARGDAHEGGSSVEERIAVGCVIRTRSRASGRSLKSVCLAPLQFSCWNPGQDANHRWVMDQALALVERRPIDPLLSETLYLAGGIVTATILDRTGGANHYYAPAAMVPPGRVPPWAVGKTPIARVGRQVFYRL